MYKIKRAVHIDFHNMPGIHDFCRDFDPERIALMLKSAGVEYINAFAKCNLGFAYYPTNIGIQYPGLKRDIFGELLEECHRKGIGVTAYVNAGLDHEHARLHREWCVQNKEGQVIYGDRTLYAFRNMCYNTGYRGYLTGMLKEILERYDVDGIFCDCMWLNVCYGNECLEAIKSKGLDPLDDGNVKKHSMEVRMDMSREIKSIVGGERYLYLNGVPNHDANHLNTHIEIECLPSGSWWGYDYFLPQASYFRNLNKNTIYMTGRFQKDWGDFGGFKGKASLENDIWDAISNGLGVSIGDHMHPSGQLEADIYKVIGDIYKDVERLEPYTEGAAYLADIGVLTDSDGVLSDTYKGLARMLGELKYSFDIVNEDMELEKYKLLILPDTMTVADSLKNKLEKHLSEGRGVLSTGEGGLDPKKAGFALEQWTFQYDGLDEHDSSYFRIRKSMGMDIEDINWFAYSQGVLIKKAEDAEVLADYVKPYFERHWDGFHGYFYTPPEKETKYAAAARSNNIYHISFKIFDAYYRTAMHSHKLLVKHCLEKLLPEPLLICEGLPSTARATLTAKEDKVLLHVKVTYPEARGLMKIIEEHQKLQEGASVCVKGQYARVFSAIDGRPVEFEPSGMYTKIRLPQIEGYAMYVLEK